MTERHPDIQPERQPRITSLGPSKRDATRIIVKVDRKSVATVPSTQIESLGLQVDQPWTDELAARVTAAAAYGKAMKSAMNRLAHRMLSRHQLGDRLRRADHPAEAVEMVLDRLEELELINDLAFGRELIRQVTGRRPAGSRLLRAKLAEKGLPQPIVTTLLAEFEEQSADTQVDDATRLARVKARTLTRYDAATQKRRLYGMLARRGFNNDVIQSAIASVINDRADDDAV